AASVGSGQRLIRERLDRAPIDLQLRAEANLHHHDDDQFLLWIDEECRATGGLPIIHPERSRLRIQRVRRRANIESEPETLPYRRSRCGILHGLAGPFARPQTWSRNPHM